MKTKSLFIAALMVVVSSAFAGKDEPRRAGLVVLPVKGTEVYKLIYKGETAGRVKVNILDNKGKVIFSEAINGLDGFIFPMNFAGLASGEYTVQVIDASGKKEEKISFEALKPTSTVKHVRVSKLANQDGKFLVSVSNTGTEKINLRIYDKAENLLYIENKEIVGNFAQVYKLTGNSGFRFHVTDAAGNTTKVEF